MEAALLGGEVQEEVVATVGAVADPRIIRIAEYVDRNGVVKDQEFENCLIQGPAILLPCGEGVSAFVDCSFAAFGEDLDAIFHVIPPGPKNGFVGIDGVSFRHCAFENIGFGGTEDALEEIRAAVTQ